jgi:hypothetical protein
MKSIANANNNISHIKGIISGTEGYYYDKFTFTYRQSPRLHLLSWREFVEENFVMRIAISHRRNVTTGGRVDGRTKK